jgi:6-pyruvoyltetrahydropterin/6-carboxytetrahydropterin synthase
MYAVVKRFDFEAAHSLPHLPSGHKCRNVHGHSYRVILVLESEELDARGFVVDYADLDPFGEMIRTEIDHRNLDDLLSRTTAEDLARYFYEWAKPMWSQLAEVRVSETAKTWVTYRP